MLYSDEFVQSLKHNPIIGVLQACEMAIDSVDEDPMGGFSHKEVEVLIEIDLLLTELKEAKLLPVPYRIKPVKTHDESNGVQRCHDILGAVQNVLSQCRQIEQRSRTEQMRSRFKATLGTVFTYEFSQGDLDRVQVLLNELRKLIADSSGLESEHQQRLLKRLEALQAEMHKKMSDLDRFWGLVGDAGVALGKLGNDAKPIVDRIREITDIVWKTQGRAEELPSGAKPPQIGHSKADDEDA